MEGGDAAQPAGFAFSFYIEEAAISQTGKYCGRSKRNESSKCRKGAGTCRRYEICGRQETIKNDRLMRQSKYSYNRGGVKQQQRRKQKKFVKD